jgi:carbon storage regulator
MFIPWNVRNHSELFFSRRITAMLVLTRKPGEKIHIGSGITITVLEIRGNKIRIGIEAPEEVKVLRAELSDWVEFHGAKSSEPHATLPRRPCR